MLKDAMLEPTMDPGDIVDIKLTNQTPRQVGKGEPFSLLIYEDNEMIQETFQSVRRMKAATLGKVIEFGLKPGEVCRKTFRKTPYELLRYNLNVYGPEMNGRELLEVTAVAVILSAVHDYCQVVEGVRREEGTFDEVGEKYITGV